MAGTTDNTSAPSGNGVSEAADVFQNLLTPDNPDTDEDEHKEGAQGKKPTGTRAQASEEESEEESESESEGDDQGDEPEEGESEEGESESEEGEGSEAESEGDQLFTVTVDGKDTEVTLDELGKGYLRNKDYTQKTQAVAEERRQVQTERSEVNAMREQYAQGLQELEQALKQIAPSEPDWDTLKKTDPIGYMEAWTDHQRQQAVLQQIAEERENLQRRQEHEQQVQRKESAKAAREWLLKQVPEWKDAAKAKADREAMAEYAVKAGWKPEELANVDDPRAILLIRNAMLYEQLRAKKDALIKPVQKKPATSTKLPVLKPGSVKSTSGKVTSELTRAKQRLAKTGHVRDAAAVFEIGLRNERSGG